MYSQFFYLRLVMKMHYFIIWLIPKIMNYLTYELLKSCIEFLVLLIRIILLQLASVYLLLFELNDLVLELLDEFAPVAAYGFLGLALVQTLLVLVVFAVVLVRPLPRREKV